MSEGKLFGHDPLPLGKPEHELTLEEEEKYKQEIEAAQTEEELHAVQERWGGKRHTPGESIIPEFPYHKKLEKLFRDALKKQRES